MIPSAYVDTCREYECVLSLDTYLHDDLPRQLIDDHLLLRHLQYIFQVSPQRAQVPFYPPHLGQFHIASPLAQRVDGVQARRCLGECVCPWLLQDRGHEL